MAAAEQVDRVSVEDYLAGELASEVKHEYLAGVLYAMAGAENVHNLIATNFLGVLHGRLRDKPCLPFNSDTKARVQLSENDIRFYYPDGMVVCEESPRNESYQEKPIILLEVLSDSTRRIDIGEKLEAYQTIPTLQLYLLAEQQQPKVIGYHRTERGFARQVYTGLDAVVHLPEIDEDLSLADLYSRVDFASEEARE